MGGAIPFVQVFFGFCHRSIRKPEKPHPAKREALSAQHSAETREKMVRQKDVAQRDPIRRTRHVFPEGAELEVRRKQDESVR